MGKHAAIARDTVRMTRLSKQKVALRATASNGADYELDVGLHTSRGSEIRSFMSIRTIIGVMWTIVIDLL